LVGALTGLALLGGITGCAGGGHRSAAGGPSASAVPVGSERAVVAAGAARPPRRGCDAPALVAHRGEAGDGRSLPENTWQAELDAAARGVTYLNTDVRWTADGVPVALHDATVGRTTSERRPDTPITSLTARQYTALDARYYAGDTSQGRIDPQVHPDTLAELLAEVGGTGRPIVLQMEADPFTPAEAGGSPGRDFLDLADVINSSGYADRVIVAGWTLRDLSALHTIDPSLTLAYLFESIHAKQYPNAIEVREAGARIVYADYRGIDAQRTRAWHAGGLKVWAWTPATRAAWQSLAKDGVDAIATNWAANYLAWESHPCSAASAV
jgi:glycerophosphoryl diester phosphodiesterase